MLELAGVSRPFRASAEVVWAVKDASLTAHSGEFVCIFGSSGSGKSTLLNVIAGLDRPSEGTVRVGGKEVTSMRESERARLRRDTIGVVFQDHLLLDEFTAAENVALPLEATGMSIGRARNEALNELARVGLRDVADRLPSQLSGGQRQRVGIARALVGDRRILLADEPTGSLDTTASLEIFEILRSLARSGVLVVLCSHDPRCHSYVDTVYEMVDGRPQKRELES